MENDNELTTTLLQITWFVELVEVIPKWPHVSGCFRFKNYSNSSNVCWFWWSGAAFSLLKELPWLPYPRYAWGGAVAFLVILKGESEFLWCNYYDCHHPEQWHVRILGSDVDAWWHVVIVFLFETSPVNWESRSQPTRIEWNERSVALW